ncbi:ATP12 family protein [Asaia platycodi]|uniref:ATP12 family protein n=1 Tax=Asaia platycodi TaxID=610243 RepID=UPI00046EF74F|nr:ATP12 family protein [Asaia platycodi]
MSQTIKRFWKEVHVVPSDVPSGHEVRLDGRSFRLPGGNPLIVPSRALAERIAEEWRAITPGAAFRTSDLPLTQMAGTQIERIAPDREQIIGGLMAYGESDLLCYRATGALGREQDVLFDPALDLFEAHHGVRPPITRSLLPHNAGIEVQDAYAAALGRLDDAALTCVAVCAPATGSLILAIGLAEGWIDLVSACAMASVEERHQMAQWGEDDALIQEMERNASDIGAALDFVTLAHEKASNEA